MSEKLNAAIEALQEDLEKQLAEVAETKRVINSLCRRIGRSPLYEEEVEQVRSSAIRADQFYGKPLATAVREFLEMNRNKGAVEVNAIFQGLQVGGFDFKGTGWKEKDYLRMLAISVAKNTQMFHKLPNGMFGLLSWYPEAANRRAEKSSDDSKKAGNGVEETTGDGADQTVTEGTSI